MGTHNRERRKAKQRVRDQRRRERAARASVYDLAPEELIATVADAAVFALGAGNDEEFERCVAMVAGSPEEQVEDPQTAEFIDSTVFNLLLFSVTAVWPRGWQPQDVIRMVDRLYGQRQARLAGDLIVAELRRYALATVDERWDAQLRALGAEVWWQRDGEYLRRWRERERLDRPAMVGCALEVLYVLRGLPEIPQLCPPPGKARRGSLAGSGRAAARDADQRMLARVRALLAKAESTEFPEEADALTAKAQELMARHSIDYALLAAAEGGREEPGGVRVGVDNPYEAAKSTLLAVVAEANRCKAVWSKHLGFSTVLGFPADLESVELLYTSLLVQATSAMMREGSRRDRSGRSRTRSFRQSFLHAYATRIGERLRGASDEANRAAVRERGSDLLPVLAARDGAVREATEAMFPELTYRPVSITNAEGWASGTAAADLASLRPHAAVPGATP